MYKKITSIISLLFLSYAGNVLAQCYMDGQAVPCSEVPTWFWFIFILFGLLFLVVGLLFLFKPTMMIKFQNKINGVSTNINPTAIIVRRIMGVIFTVAAIMILIFILSTIRNIY